MLIIPAIDLRNGRCVRLYQGKADRETVYGDNPVEVAIQWERLGAKLLHLVDLDGAFTGFSKNKTAVTAISENVHIPLQLGGGIRSRAAVEKALSAGVSRLILGTMVIEEPDLARELIGQYPGVILVAIDTLDGMVAVRGWTESSQVDAADLATRVEQWGIKEIILTDIERDGTMQGPDLAGLENILAHTDLQIIISGGISSLNDLIMLKPYAKRLKGIIIGKALYANQFTLPDALAVAAG